MNRFRALILSTLLLAFAALPAVAKATNGPLASFEGGKLYRTDAGKFAIVELRGSFRQMGRQYGRLMADDMKSFYQAAVDDFLIRQKKISYDVLKKSGEERFSVLPQYLKDFFDGVCETSPLPRERVLIMSNLPLLLVMGPGACSSLSAWDEYTGRRPLVVGRNWDLPCPWMKDFMKYLCVVVFNPEGSGNSVANVDFCGSFFYQTAMNSQGIFLELQNGQNCDPFNCDDRADSNDLLFRFLVDSSSMDDIDKYFKAVRPNCGLIMNASGADVAHIYEWSTFRVLRRDAKGVLSASNDFVDPTWQEYGVPAFTKANEGIGLSVTRRTNLASRAEESKGRIDAREMMRIFDLSISKGGPSFLDPGDLKTLYQVVAVPGELKMWLKVPTWSDWEEIDLKGHF